MARKNKINKNKIIIIIKKRFLHDFPIGSIFFENRTGDSRFVSQEGRTLQQKQQGNEKQTESKMLKETQSTRLQVE